MVKIGLSYLALSALQVEYPRTVNLHEIDLFFAVVCKPGLTLNHGSIMELVNLELFSKLFLSVEKRGSW